MSYPTIERYQEALQHPENAFNNQELRHAKFKNNGLGIPLALCGGFALTYTATCINNKKYAVRCFHKQSNLLEERYTAISQKLKSLNSAYFLEFDFHAQGILIDKKYFPILKMAWALGETLGTFIEKNLQNSLALANLRTSLRKLALFLELNNMAHGDIQIDNIIVSQEGQSIKLIDYDGMYVDTIKYLGSSELGQRNFQHPQREKLNPYDNTLDRFSLISLTLALEVLEKNFNLWRETSSGDAVIFRANDFNDPSSSTTFARLSGIAGYNQKITWFKAICEATYLQVPALEDFLNGINIPQEKAQSFYPTSHAYIPAFPVVNASDFWACFKQVGNKVELIGKIIEIKEDIARNRRPYIFLNFGNWRGENVKLVIWDSDRPEFRSFEPQGGWVGKWISVTGLVMPPFKNTTHHAKPYTHIAINIDQKNQVTLINEDMAMFRLGKPQTSPTINSSKASTNIDILERVKKLEKSGSQIKQSNLAPSSNKVLLNKIYQTQIVNSIQYSQASLNSTQKIFKPSFQPLPQKSLPSQPPERSRCSNLIKKKACRNILTYLVILFFIYLFLHIFFKL
jgi:serine/threonine protein kinase